MDWAQFWLAKNGLGSLLVSKKWTGLTSGQQKMDWSTFSITGPLCSAKVRPPGSFLADKFGPTVHFLWGPVFARQGHPYNCFPRGLMYIYIYMEC